MHHAAAACYCRRRTFRGLCVSDRRALQTRLNRSRWGGWGRCREDGKYPVQSVEAATKRHWWPMSEAADSAWLCLSSALGRLSTSADTAPAACPAAAAAVRWTAGDVSSRPAQTRPATTDICPLPGDLSPVRVLGCLVLSAVVLGPYSVRHTVHSLSPL